MLNGHTFVRPVLSSRLMVIGAGAALIATASFAVGRHRSDLPTSVDLRPCDGRIKTDVRDLKEDGLDKIDQLRPIAYRYNREYIKANPEVDGREHYGVIAQEYAGVFPQFVSETAERTADGEAILGVDIQPAVIHALAAIQQLHEESIKHQSALEQHAQRIEDLMKQIEELEQEIDAKDALLRKAAEELTERVKKLENADKAAPREPERSR